MEEIKNIIKGYKKDLTLLAKSLKSIDNIKNSNVKRKLEDITIEEMMYLNLRIKQLEHYLIQTKDANYTADEGEENGQKN